MSELKYLQFQPIDPEADADTVDSHADSEQIILEEGIDEGKLEQFWDSVEKDIQEDPDWFNFSDK